MGFLLITGVKHLLKLQLQKSTQTGRFKLSIASQLLSVIANAMIVFKSTKTNLNIFMAYNFSLWQNNKSELFTVLSKQATVVYYCLLSRNARCSLLKIQSNRGLSQGHKDLILLWISSNFQVILLFFSKCVFLFFLRVICLAHIHEVVFSFV